jgi:NAD(P)-dependent dehydrogenase (short-subunit alcohol dehydrogenase family)
MAMTAKPFELSGKVAIVTGGNGGIGLGMACGLGEAGAALAIVGRNATKSKQAVANLASSGIIVRCRRPESIAAAIRGPKTLDLRHAAVAICQFH